jgi:hypothetical protein
MDDIDRAFVEKLELDSGLAAEVTQKCQHSKHDEEVETKDNADKSTV